MPTKTIKFNDHIKAAYGRNGYIHCTGIEVLGNVDSDTVMLTPFTSKGKLTTSCFIEFPVCKIDEVIEALQQVKEHAKQEEESTKVGDQKEYEETYEMYKNISAVNIYNSTPTDFVKIKLGGKITFQGEDYICVKHDNPHVCDGCDLYENEQIDCCAICCQGNKRADHIDVRFEKIKEDSVDGVIKFDSIDEIENARPYSIEVAIGSTIKIGDKEYKCIKQTDNAECLRDCVFYEKQCQAIRCLAENRADNTDVMFVEQE